MAQGRGLTIAALGVAGGVGYYLYNAGGDPKAAEKKMEADVHKLSAKIKSEIPLRTEQAESKGKELSARAQAEYERASSEAKSKLSEAQSKAAELKDKAIDYKDKTGKELNKAVDQFDKTVEKKASEAKSGLSSWFGGK